MSRHGKSAPGTATITFKTTKAIKAELTAIAEADGRSLSNYLRHECKQIVDEHRMHGPLDGHSRPPKDAAG